MVVVTRDDGMVEARSLTGEVIELDQESYDLAKGLMQLYRRTNPKVLKAAAERLTMDPEPSLESSFLLDSIGLYLDRIQPQDMIA